jgi:hypothetical protein
MKLFAPQSLSTVVVDYRIIVLLLTTNIMANRQAFQNYLQTIGFPADLRAALVAQGLDTIGNLYGMTDDDVEDLCANIRKPGGVVPNPANADDPEAVQFITDPGVAVGRIYQERLKQLAFYYSYLVIVNRTFVAAQADVGDVLLWRHKKYMENILNRYPSTPMRSQLGSHNYAIQ